MSARKRELATQVNQVLDALLIGLTLWICYQLRGTNFIVLDSLSNIPPFEKFYWILALVMPFGPLFLEAQGFYRNPAESTVARSLVCILRASFWIVLLLAVAALLLRLDFPSRSVAILFALLAPFTLLLRERLTAWGAQRRLKQGKGREPVLLVGDGEGVKKFRGSLSSLQRLEMNFVQTIDLADPDSSASLGRALQEHSVGRVILAVRSAGIDQIQKVVDRCEAEGVDVWLSAAFIQTSVARPVYDSLDRRPMLVFRAVPDHSWEIYIKNALDFIGSFFCLLLFSPVFLVVAILVRCTSSGPIFFAQKRAGLHGKPFTMFKFRTMYVDAEERRRELLEKNQMSGPVFKLENDPRITPLGKILRKFSIDEFPQLLNVLRGEMSLVGPRPLPIYETEQFEDFAHRRRLSMKPGLTCLWQVRGRSKVTDFEEWVKMDLEYIDNWSLALDIYIILRTIPAVLLGAGAK